MKTEKTMEQEKPMEDVKKEKRKVLKNIFLISGTFLMLFNAFQNLSRLQSSLHLEEGLGVISQSLVYAGSVISAFFLPVILIANIGHKWSLVISFLGYILWMAANGYPDWPTMVPASLIVGVASAPLWTSQSSYFSLFGAYYAKLTGATESTIITRFFGIFFCFFQSANITGAIISSTILMPKGAGNKTFDESKDLCGAQDCPYYNISNPNLDPPSDTTIWTMLGVFIGIAALAFVLLAIFLDPMPEGLYEKPKSIKKEITGLLFGTFRHLRQRKMLLLIPITFYSGLEQTFHFAEFTKSYVSCPYGIWAVGFVTIPFGIVNAIVSLGSASVVKYTGRIPVFVTGMVVDIVNQLVLLFWRPTEDTVYLTFILFGVWGFTDAIWQTQVNALYGVIFIKDTAAAFSNRLAFASIGFIVGFAYSNFICTSTKLYIILSVLIVGMIGYIIVEIMYRAEISKKPPESDSKDSKLADTSSASSVEESKTSQLGDSDNIISLRF